MKQNDISEIEEKLEAENLANIFHVYKDIKIGPLQAAYSINRTLNIKGLNNASKAIFSSYTVLPGDTWTIISKKQYGTVKLWWIICKMNSIKDPTQEPEPGQVFKILKEMYVEQILAEIARK